MEQDYSYTFVTNSLKPAPINVKKQNNSCAFEICDETMLKKLGKSNCVDLFENDNITQFAADYAAMDYNALIKQTEAICNETLSNYVINNARALCNYFKETTAFFDDLEAQGRVLKSVMFKKHAKDH